MAVVNIIVHRVLGGMLSQLEFRLELIAHFLQEMGQPSDASSCRPITFSPPEHPTSAATAVSAGTTGPRPGVEPNPQVPLVLNLQTVG